MKAPQPPSGVLWLHEIKHDGFRVVARKDGDRVRLYSRPGNDLTYRFPLIVEALAKLSSRSCIIDGEAVACDDNGLPSFNRIRYRRHDASVFLYAFDLIGLNGDDLRRDPLEVRKATLASTLPKAGPGIRFNEHIEGDGPTVFAHACKMGLEGIVSKRKGSAYRSGRSPDWLKMKNPACDGEARGGGRLGALTEVINHEVRLRRAKYLGALADRLFRNECARLGLNADEAIKSPLMSIITRQSGQVVTARKRSPGQPDRGKS
jgi:bifunctional non-homologous end joining protein LigD